MSDERLNIVQQKRDPREHYAETCDLRPNNKSCALQGTNVKNTKYFLCDVYSINKLAASVNLSCECLGVWQGFNGTHDVGTTWRGALPQGCK